MAAGTITIRRGEDFVLTLAFTKESQTPCDLTGCQLDFNIQRNALADPVVSKHLTTFGDPATGEASIALADDDTDIEVRAWRYRIKLTDKNGNEHIGPLGYWVSSDTAPMTSEPVTVVLGPGNIDVSLQIDAPSEPEPAEYGDAQYNLDKSFVYA
jgi:hypothetical protein